jgi:hypothetical protein
VGVEEMAVDAPLDDVAGMDDEGREGVPNHHAATAMAMKSRSQRSMGACLC